METEKRWIGGGYGVFLLHASAARQVIMDFWILSVNFCLENIDIFQFYVYSR